MSRKNLLIEKVHSSTLSNPNTALALKCCGLVGLAAMAVAMSPETFAGTTGEEFKPAYEKFTSLITGFGGKMVAGVSLATAIIGSALRFNPYLIFGSLGVGITAALGTKILDTVVGALI